MSQTPFKHGLSERPCRQAEDGGTLVISLDFELFWGWRDKASLRDHRLRLDRARANIPRLLDIFLEYRLHVTWATVGLLFYDGRARALAGIPRDLPDYDDDHLSPYKYLSSTGLSGRADPYHYARSLITQIRATPNQEIGTHTFSHFYCLEPGATVGAFEADLASAIQASETVGVIPRSIVFPRNQVNESHLAICRGFGLLAYRGTEDAWPYRPVLSAQQNPLRRGARLLDTYLNLTGRHTFDVIVNGTSRLANIPASRYLRPFNRRLRYLEPLKLRRIFGDMTSAARAGRAYHLWWHPEELGVNGEENLSQVRRIASHFRILQESHGMRSMTMAELADSADRTDLAP